MDVDLRRAQPDGTGLTLRIKNSVPISSDIKMEKLKMNFLTEWFDDLESRTESAWKISATVNGICKVHTGPSIRYASLTLVFSPSSQFEVEDKLSNDIRRLIQERNWYRSIIFGVFDVMLTTPKSPIRNFKLTIENIDFNEIESTPIAFRMAARDAARKALQEQFLM